MLRKQRDHYKLSQLHLSVMPFDESKLCKNGSVWTLIKRSRMAGSQNCGRRQTIEGCRSSYNKQIIYCMFAGQNKQNRF